MSHHQPEPMPSPRRRGWRLRDRRIRVKLALILTLPVVAVLALAGVIAVGAASGAMRGEQARQLVALGGAAGDLAGQLQRERAGAALVFTRGGGPAAVEEYRKRTAGTDAAAERFRAARAAVRLPDGLVAPADRVVTQLAALPGLRQQVQSAPDVRASLALFRYRAVIADLVAYRQGLSQAGVDAATANGLRASATLSQAVESLGLLQVAGVRAVDVGALTPAGQQEVLAADAGFVEATQAFRDLAPAGWQTALTARVGGEQVLRAERLQGVVLRAGPGEALRLDTDAAGWVEAVGARMAAMHAVEADLDGALLGAVTGERDQQRRSVVLLSTVVLAALIAVVALGWWVARSLAASLTRLRAGAERIAGHQLPSMVSVVESGGADLAAAIEAMRRAAEPLPVDGRDEVGQVAAAFNTVVAEAVRIAGEQVAIRASVAAIFEALSRRLQRRVDRMIASLDQLERHEEDPDRLAQLFELDHVATLIRRLIASLQVLSGTGAGRSVPAAVPLPDLLRAAIGEIDDYQRVDLRGADPGVAVVAQAAPDLVHLLAELLDNAATFSPPLTPVALEGWRVGDQLHIQVSDEGVGIREEDLPSVRQRVARPDLTDPRTAQHMGLPVVGRIAQRLGITVEVRSRWQHGTSVDITVPAALFTTTAPAHAGNQPTAELPAVAAIRPGPAGPLALPSALPSWPPVAGDQPAAAVRAPAEVPPLRIYESVRASWFTEGADGGGVPAVPSDWQAASVAAAEAGRAAPQHVTEHGLPVRRAGARLIPAVTQPAEVTPVRRDPDEVRRQMSAFQTGLGAAGRRSLHALVKEPAQ
ncbi:nitrate- and nitrite sensing domain-containing protein [Dactylosporangium fulvum]|uniref:histidine kinase n=1 Tax=Dactylosporangium fulvum TaxID=53359 RepID=A0ABY5VZ32_9ACTN|nr:sensor histidine kinase [Dactylosporangium fulvum]UWP82419.1 sensor histidine kinase [Dactylosporangium fulvum]